ncbi:MAG: hypothetical protein IPM29_19175 [Planctomycetes bacterium]|nr:hypothetical protein [Planctomycetota bacterium]
MNRNRITWSTGAAAADFGLAVPRELVVLHGPRRDRGHRGVAAFDDGAERFAVALLGPGSLDWSYDPAIAELQIEGVRGTGPGTELVVVHLAGRAFHVADAMLDAPLGAFRCDAVFGELGFLRQCGGFTFCDGRFRVTLALARETNLHYDGALGTLDATPVDGSLAISTRGDRRARGAAPVALRARASVPGVLPIWRQIGGPLLPAVVGADGGLEVLAGGLGAGQRAVYAVVAEHGDSIAIESVVVHGQLAPLPA